MITKIKKKFKSMLKNIPGGNFLDGTNFLEEEWGRFTWEPWGDLTVGNIPSFLAGKLSDTIKCKRKVFS